MGSIRVQTFQCAGTSDKRHAHLPGGSSTYAYIGAPLTLHAETSCAGVALNITGINGGRLRKCTTLHLDSTLLLVAVF